jgi:hypothetical protein
MSKKPRYDTADVSRVHRSSNPIFLPVTTPTKAVVQYYAAKTHILNLDSAASAVVSQRAHDWLQARGCLPWGSSASRDDSDAILHSMFLNGDLQAAQVLAWRELYDPAHDRRQDAMGLYWQAALQGSTCALQSYYVFGKGLSDAKREVETIHGGRKAVRYTHQIPENTATKRNDILDAYAWDLVYEMRAGVISEVMYSRMLENDYHYRFKFTAADYARACALADKRYNDLLAARETDGYGPFDNSPPPVMADSATNPARIGKYCKSWPGGRSRCQRAQFHYVDQQGNAHAVLGWECWADNTVAP